MKQRKSAILYGEGAKMKPWIVPILLATLLLLPSEAAKKPKYIPGHAQLPGQEAAVGEWAHLPTAKSNIKVIDWAFVTEPPKIYPGFSLNALKRQMQNGESALLQIDFEFKNPTGKPRKIPGPLELTLVGQNDETITRTGHFHGFQNLVGKTSIEKKLLPGQGYKASFFMETPSDFVPAKLVLIRKYGKEEDPVVRVFLQQGNRLGEIQNAVPEVPVASTAP